jgi:hypothetical protein
VPVDVAAVRREVDSLRREQALARELLRSLQTDISAICSGLQRLKEQVSSCIP